MSQNLASSKVCPSCGEQKLFSEFSLNRTRKDGHQNYCKLCFSAVIKRNPEKHRARRRRWVAKYPQRAKDIALKCQLKLYGLTVEQYKQLEMEQEGKCAICYVKPKRRLDVDHDHVTGEVRGLLCGRCNRLLGLADDSEAVLESASYYVRSRKRKAA